MYTHRLLYLLQTVNQREKKTKLQEKRKALMAARLAKVRERKQLKQPAPEEEEEKTGEGGEGEGGGGEEKEVGEEEGGSVDPIAAMIESELGRAREKAEKEEGGRKEGVREEGESGRKKKPYVRPWDKGKGLKLLTSI